MSIDDLRIISAWHVEKSNENHKEPLGDSSFENLGVIALFKLHTDSFLKPKHVSIIQLSNYTSDHFIPEK